jgi:hypothetical protein
MKLAGYTEIKTSAGRPLFVRTNMHPLFMRIYKEHRADYHMTSIMRTLWSLNADALRGKSLNPAGDERSIIHGHIGMKYSLFNGVVLVHLLAINRNQAPEKTGLFTVRLDDERRGWIRKGNSIKTLDNTQQWKSQDKQAHYAAVAGRFSGGIEDAAKHMPEHIVGAYEKAHYLTRHDRGNQYSLFWIEKGAHKSQDSAQSLASIMQQSTKNNLPVNWLIHGDAIHTFKNTVKLIQSAPLASASTRAKDATAGKAQNQRVYFSNPASSDSEKSLKALCEQAGLTFVDVNTSNRDLRRWSTLKNVGRNLGKPVMIGLAVGGTQTSDIGLKALGVDGIDKIVSRGMDAFFTGNHLGVAVSAAATGWIVISAFSKRKTLGASVSASVKCTFGKGNERWYTDDAALLS